MLARSFYSICKDSITTRAHFQTVINFPSPYAHFFSPPVAPPCVCLCLWKGDSGMKYYSKKWRMKTWFKKKKLEKCFRPELCAMIQSRI